MHIKKHLYMNIEYLPYHIFADSLRHQLPNYNNINPAIENLRSNLHTQFLTISLTQIDQIHHQLYPIHTNIP